MTAEERAKIDAIERDRRRKEDELAFLLLLLLSTTSTYAIHAIRLGMSPVDAVLRVWLGTGGGFPGVAPAIANVMMKSHAAGMARGAGFVGGTKPTPSDVPDLYRSMARTMAEQAGETLRQVAADAVATTDDPRQQAKALRQAFKDGGYTEDNPFAAQRIATGAIMRSYGLGLYQAYQHADISGFRHISVLDDRTTTICKERSGLTLLKGDDYWLGNWCPLHQNCRSTILPIRGAVAWSDTYPTTPPATGWGTIPQEMLRIARPWQPRAA